MNSAFVGYEELSSYYKVVGACTNPLNRNLLLINSV